MSQTHANTLKTLKTKLKIILSQNQNNILSYGKVKSLTKGKHRIILKLTNIQKQSLIIYV